MVWLYFFCLVNKKNCTKGNTEYSIYGVLNVSTSIIKGSGHTDNGGRATPCKTDITKRQIRMSIFLFLETILFPLPKLLLLADDNSFDLDSVDGGLTSSQLTFHS